MKQINHVEIIAHIKSLSLDSNGYIKDGMVSKLAKDMGLSYQALYKIVRGLRGGSSWSSMEGMVNWWLRGKKPVKKEA